MTLAIKQPHFTPDDLLSLDEDGLFELVDGKLLEKKMSALANETAVIISFHVYSFLRATPLGKLYSEQTYKCFPHDPGLVRRPDLSYVAAGRISLIPLEGHSPVGPDLAIEVLSANDKAYELDRKLADYRSAGVKVTWVVNPELRTLRIHRLDHTITELLETDVLSGESVLPGFSIAVVDLLPTNKL